MRSNPIATSSPPLYRVSSPLIPPASARLRLSTKMEARIHRPIPHRKGSIVVFYVTGAGVFNAAGIDGQIAQDPLLKPRATIQAYIAAMHAEVLSVSAVPGLATGLVQVRIRLPANSPTGDAVPLDISADGTGSQPGVTLAIREAVNSGG